MNLVKGIKYLYLKRNKIIEKPSGALSWREVRKGHIPQQSPQMCLRTAGPLVSSLFQSSHQEANEALGLFMNR